MQPKTTMALLLLVTAGLTALAVRGNAVSGGEPPAVPPAAEASATAGKEEAEAAKPDPAAAARAKKMEKVKKLGCFQCHNFEHYLNGRPKVAKPPGGPAVAELPAGACGGPGHECKGAPPPAVAAAKEGEGEAKAAHAAESGGGKAPAAEDEDGEDQEAGDDKAENEDAAAEEEEEESPPDPKDFAHGPHEEEGVGHCHQCHAMEGHFQVKVRMQACAECH